MKTDISLHTSVNNSLPRKAAPSSILMLGGRDRQRRGIASKMIGGEYMKVIEIKNSKNRYLKSEENILRSKVLSINKFSTVKD